MKEVALINEYGSRYGVELIFDTYAEMREYEQAVYGEEGFPKGCDVWDQVRITVLEKIDPEGIVANLISQGKSYDEIRQMGFFLEEE